MTTNDPLDTPVQPETFQPEPLRAWELDEPQPAPAPDQADPSAPFPVTPIWRARLFLANLILSALVALCGGLAAVWAPDYADAVFATGAAILSALGIVTGGLGVAYRQSPGVLR